eukprot:4599076-Amphidinium_carterae.3
MLLWFILVYEVFSLRVSNIIGELKSPSMFTLHAKFETQYQKVATSAWPWCWARCWLPASTWAYTPNAGIDPGGRFSFSLHIRHKVDS